MDLAPTPSQHGFCRATYRRSTDAQHQARRAVRSSASLTEGEVRTTKGVRHLALALALALALEGVVVDDRGLKGVDRDGIHTRRQICSSLQASLPLPNGCTSSVLRGGKQRGKRWRVLGVIRSLRSRRTAFPVALATRQQQQRQQRLTASLRICWRERQRQRGHPSPREPRTASTAAATSPGLKTEAGRNEREKKCILIEDRKPYIYPFTRSPHQQTR